MTFFTFKSLTTVTASQEMFGSFQEMIEK